MKRPFKILSIGYLTLLALPAQASDIRALGMGGAATTAGQGVQGVVANPALLGTYRVASNSFQLSTSIEARDSSEVVSDFDENEQLIDDLDTAIDDLLAQTLTCNPVFSQASDVCLSGTAALGNLAAELGNLLNDIDGEPFDIRAVSNIGFTSARASLPYSIDFSVSATITGVADVSDADRDYVSDISGATSDDTLTLGEINDNTTISLSAAGNSLSIGLPDDVLDSRVEGSAVIRTQLAIGLSQRFFIADTELDIGIRPRLSNLLVGNLNRSINDDDDIDAGDEFEASENSETSLTVDVGATMLLSGNEDIRIGAAVKNLLPESIQTTTGFVVESTPQLIVSAAYLRDNLTLSADLALNEASYDNFDTQTLNLGGEVLAGPLSLRAGLSNDFSLDDNPTAASLGLGIGFLDIGVRASASNVMAGMQIAFGF